MVAADPVADPVEGAEVERRSGDGRRLAGRDQRRVHRRVAARVELELVVVDVPRPLAGEVEVGVVGEVDHRRLVGRRLVVDVQLVPVVEPVEDLDRQRSRVALLAVGGRVRQAHADGAARPHLGGRPHAAVEAARAAVEAVRRVVDRELERLPVDRERALGDAVAVAADDRAEVRVALVVRLARVAADVAEAERDVLQAPAAIGDADRLDRAAPGDDRDGHAAVVRERVLVDRRAVGQRAERRLDDRGGAAWAGAATSATSAAQRATTVNRAS